MGAGLRVVKAEARTVGPKKWERMGLSRVVKSAVDTRSELLPVRLT